MKANKSLDRFSSALNENGIKNSKLVAAMNTDQKIVLRHILRDAEKIKKIGRGYGSDTAMNTELNRVARNEAGANIGGLRTPVGSAAKYLKEITVDKLLESRRLELAQIFKGDTAKQLADKLRQHPVGSPQASITLRKFINKLAEDAKNNMGRSAIIGTMPDADLQNAGNQ